QRKLRWIKVAAAVLMLAGAMRGAVGQDNGAAQFRIGGFFPSGGGEFFDENEQVFNFDPSDLDGWAFGFTYLMPVSPHLELGWSLDYAEGTDVTEYRDGVDENGFL